jgi:hypothetical protein
LNSSSERRPRVRTRSLLASLGLTVAAVALFGAPGTASASKVNCAGSLKPSVEQAGSKTAVQYSFMCDQAVLAYSITLNRSIDLFDPEVLPLLPTGEASGELASCEGSFPGFGIGCTAQSSSCPSAATATACTGQIGIGHTVTSEFETTKPYCAKKRTKYGPLTAYLTTSTVETTAAGKTFVNSSQPFHLDDGLGCPKPSKARG